MGFRKALEMIIVRGAEVSEETLFRGTSSPARGRSHGLDHTLGRGLCDTLLTSWLWFPPSASSLYSVGRRSRDMEKVSNMLFAFAHLNYISPTLYVFEYHH